MNESVGWTVGGEQMGRNMEASIVGKTFGKKEMKEKNEIRTRRRERERKK